MALYLDTSGLVKLYIEEEDHALALRAVQQDDVVIISTVGYAEARSALARRYHEGRLYPADLREAVSELDQDWSTFVHIDVIAPLAHRAGELAERHALRGFDAIHLASALHASELFRTVHLLGFDDRLNAAAVEAGLTLYGDDRVET